MRIVDAGSSMWLKIRNFIGLDGAVVYSMLTKAWQAISGVVTLVLLAKQFTPSEQGVYYAFGSILALQVFFELGFSYVLMQFASHEMASLSWDSVGGLSGSPVAKHRVFSLIRAAIRWYTFAAVGLLIVVGLAGGLFFGSMGVELSGIQWHMPWALLVLFVAGALFISPLFSVLEGLGQVKTIAGFRIIQEVGGTSVFWLSLVLGAGLYSACIFQGVRFLLGLLWLIRRYRHVFAEVLKGGRGGAEVHWFSELWPMQWRISLSWIGGYLVNQLFTPVVFAAQGAVVAGKLGMSLSLVAGLNSAALTWMTTKAPLFGILVARKNYAALDSLFRQALVQCVGVCLSGALVIFGWGLLCTNSALSDRLLAPGDMALLLLAVLCNVIMCAEAIYLRAHKQEPFLMVSLANGVLTAVSVMIFSHASGVTLMLAAYCAVVFVVGVLGGSIVFFRKRKLWHTAAV
jgi:O-antigen/teichoic acid export membrane protein